MTFLIDECLHPSLVGVAEERDHQAHYLVEQIGLNYHLIVRPQVHPTTPSSHSSFKSSHRPS